MAYYCVIMVSAMIADTDWLDRIFFILDRLVESAHRLARVGVYLDWPAIYLRKRLNLQIIAPNLVLTLSFTVVLDGSVDSRVYEVFEVVLAGKDVGHAPLSQEIVQLLFTVHLESHCSEKAVSVRVHLGYLHLALLSELFPELFIFSLPKLN